MLIGRCSLACRGLGLGPTYLRTCRTVLLGVGITNAGGFALSPLGRRHGCGRRGATADRMQLNVGVASRKGEAQSKREPHPECQFRGVSHGRSAVSMSGVLQRAAWQSGTGRSHRINKGVL